MCSYSKLDVRRSRFKFFCSFSKSTEFHFISERGKRLDWICQFKSFVRVLLHILPLQKTFVCGLHLSLFIILEFKISYCYYKSESPEMVLGTFPHTQLSLDHTFFFNNPQGDFSPSRFVYLFSVFSSHFHKVLNFLPRRHAILYGLCT